MCRQFGHLGRDCQKRRPNAEARPINRPDVNNDGWSIISAKYAFKPNTTMVNPVLLLEANPYHSFQEGETDVGISKVDVGFSIPGLTEEHRVEHNSQDILLKVQNVESVSKVNNQWNKGKEIILDQL